MYSDMSRYTRNDVALTICAWAGNFKNYRYRAREKQNRLSSELAYCRRTEGNSNYSKVENFDQTRSEFIHEGGTVFLYVSTSAENTSPRPAAKYVEIVAERRSIYETPVYYFGADLVSALADLQVTDFPHGRYCSPRSSFGPARDYCLQQ